MLHTLFSYELTIFKGAITILAHSVIAVYVITQYHYSDIYFPCFRWPCIFPGWLGSGCSHEKHICSFKHRLIICDGTDAYTIIAIG